MCKKGFGGKFHKSTALFTAMVLLLCGCGEKQQDEHSPQEQVNEDEGKTFGFTEDFSYSVPEERSFVLVDQFGFKTEGTKSAIFVGDTLPETFLVIDKETGEIAYTGHIQTREDGVSAGTFSELEKEGTYYIECDHFGCSDYFSIGEDSYVPVELFLKDSIIKADLGTRDASDEKWYLSGGWITDGVGGRDTKDACETVSNLLFGYEMYPSLFKDLFVDENGANTFFTELRRETDWLMAMQDANSGGVYGGIRQSGAVDAVLKDISIGATGAFAGTMAKFGYLYQNEDKEYATACLKAASKAWKYLVKQKADYNQDSLLIYQYFAAAELFRASDERNYNAFLVEHTEEILSMDKQYFGLMGAITYLSTRRKVDKEVCNRLIQALLEEAEQIAGEAKTDGYFVASKDTDILLQNMMTMAFVDYVITNHEYTSVVENHIHYILGRNENGRALMENLQLKDRARFFVMLSMIEEEMEEVVQ